MARFQRGKIFNVLVALAAAVSVTFGANAQQPMPSGQEQDDVFGESTSSEIIVEGLLQERETIVRQAEQITHPPRGGRPLAYFHLPVCPKVWGLDEAAAEVVVARIKENSRELGISAAGEGCQPNIFVGVVDDLDAALDYLSDDAAWAFGSLLDYQRKRVENETGASRAWHTTVVGDRYGIPLFQVGDDVPVVNGTAPASKLRTDETNLIQAAVVLIEAGALRGKTLLQMSDFATFRALSPVNEVMADTNPALDTILSLFNDPLPAAELTPFDRAYLKAYYRPSARTAMPGRVFSSVAFWHDKERRGDDDEK